MVELVAPSRKEKYSFLVGRWIILNIGNYNLRQTLGS